MSAGPIVNRNTLREQSHPLLYVMIEMLAVAALGEERSGEQGRISEHEAGGDQPQAPAGLTSFS